jgi:hypothetical protein
MLKIKNTKHLDTAEEIFTEFLDKFQRFSLYTVLFQPNFLLSSDGLY